MNFSIVKTSRIKASKRPIHLKSLKELFGLLGVKKSKSDITHIEHFTFNSHDDTGLWDYLEQAKRIHREKIKQLHPDRTNGATHNEAAILNSIWKRIKVLCARRGYEIH